MLRTAGRIDGLPFFTPPFHRSYRELYERQGTPEAAEGLLRLLVREDEVEWGDEPRWFLDSDHLNADGMRRFTRMLREEIGGR